MPPQTPSLFTHEPLRVQVFQMPPYVVAQWRGAAPADTRAAAIQAVGDLLARDAEQVVLDLAGLDEVAEEVVDGLVRGMTEAQRLGRAVTLVRCNEELFRRFQRLGLSGSVRNVSSLLGATQGLAPGQGGNLDLYLRSSAEMLPRLRSVVAAVATEARLTPAAESQLTSAVNEAAANAITHGSPEGVRNHVRVSFHVDRTTLIVEVADQGGGFDPVGVPPPVPEEFREHGYGLHMMRQFMDRVEFFRDEAGMLVRMTKYLSG